MDVEQSQLLKREQSPPFPRMKMCWTWSKEHRILVQNYSHDFVLSLPFRSFFIFPLDLLAINSNENFLLGFIVIFCLLCVVGKILCIQVLPNNVFFEVSKLVIEWFDTKACQVLLVPINHHSCVCLRSIHLQTYVFIKLLNTNHCVLSKDIWYIHLASCNIVWSYPSTN